MSKKYFLVAIFFVVTAIGLFYFTSTYNVYLISPKFKLQPNSSVYLNKRAIGKLEHVYDTKDSLMVVQISVKRSVNIPEKAVLSYYEDLFGDGNLSFEYLGASKKYVEVNDTIYANLTVKSHRDTLIRALEKGLDDLNRKLDSNQRLFKEN